MCPRPVLMAQAGETIEALLVTIKIAAVAIVVVGRGILPQMAAQVLWEWALTRPSSTSISPRQQPWNTTGWKMHAMAALVRKPTLRLRVAALALRMVEVA